MLQLKMSQLTNEYSNFKLTVSVLYSFVKSVLVVVSKNIPLSPEISKFRASVTTTHLFKLKTMFNNSVKSWQKQDLRQKRRFISQNLFDGCCHSRQKNTWEKLFLEWLFVRRILYYYFTFFLQYVVFKVLNLNIL